MPLSFLQFLEGDLMLERDYQAYLIKELRRRFRGCVVLKNDGSYQQGIPDLLILFEDQWAVLEVKASFDAPEQPNQGWWIEELSHMSFAAFIYPENESEVLNALREAFGTRR
jgi:hypothetical protein